MFLYLKFSNFEVKTSFECSFIAFLYLRDRQNDILKFHNQAVGDWELMTSTQELANCIFNFQCYFTLESFDLKGEGEKEEMGWGKQQEND